MPTEPQVPEEEAARAIYRSDTGGVDRDFDVLTPFAKKRFRAMARAALQYAAPAIREQEIQRLARSGDLPEAFGELDPESRVGLLIRAALTVAEENVAQSERQYIQEAIEGMVKRQELNSQDAGWVVPVASIEACLETLKDRKKENA